MGHCSLFLHGTTPHFPDGDGRLHYKDGRMRHMSSQAILFTGRIMCGSEGTSDLGMDDFEVLIA